MASSPEWSSLDPSQLDLAIERRLAAREERTKIGLSSAIAPVAWLAAAPYTTSALAGGAGSSAARALVALAEHGLASASAPVGGGSADTVYAMTTAGRVAVLDLFEQQGSIGRLRRDVEVSAQRLGDTTAELPAPVRRWSDLARYASKSDVLVAALEDRVDAAFRERDAAALLNWIETARPLADLLARDLDESLHIEIERAGRRLELLHRQASDERHLESFLERKEQVDALRMLVEGPDDLWALHLFGVGGVGKTMLLRYLTGRLGPNEFRAATARIDFDYLNPDYPRLDPGLLLWSFAQELRAHDSTNAAAEKFAEADRKLKHLRQELTSARAGTSSRRSTEHPLFVGAVGNFIDALQLLQRRVIFIVDTCEELAKMRPDGTTPENVEETFRILSALHDGPVSLQGQGATRAGLPSIRVVFAGRRPLARAGHGWTCTASAQPLRTFLRLHELRGFKHSESERYLREIMHVADPLIPAVIDRSPDVGAPAVIEWTDATDRSGEVPRCNPYDLRLYADWAKDSPPPSAETIRASTAAQYVELRIMRRLESYEPLRRLMPVVALLKYIDQDLVAAALQDSDAAGQAYERLRNQEWVDERRVAAPDGGSTRVVLSVGEGLRKRLWAYFRERGGVHPGMLGPIADHLEAVTLTADLNRLDWVVFDAALRALDANPERAAPWWAKAEQRIIDERGYDWLLQVTESLLAEPNAAARREKGSPEGVREISIRGAVAASFLSALAHTGKPRTADVTWQDVLDGCATFPAGAGRTLLEWRARAGLAAAAATSASADASLVQRSAEWLLAEWVLSATALQDLPAAEWAQAAASTVSALEALVEFVEAQGGARSDAWRLLAPALRGGAGPEAIARALAERRSLLVASSAPDERAVDSLIGFSASLALRVHAWAGEDPFAVGDIALQYAKRAGQGGKPGTWRDWVPPDNVGARIGLEYARAMYPAYADSVSVLAKVSAVGSWGDIDGNYLAAMRWMLNYATSWKLLRGEGSDSRVQMWAARCAAHRVVPPQFVVTSANFAAFGQVGTALDLLKRISREVTGDLVTTRHVDRALARIFLQMRLFEVGERIPGSLSQSPVAEDRGLVWTAASHVGDTASIPADVPGFVGDDPLERGRWLHELWQSRAALDPASATDAVAWAEQHLLYDTAAAGDDFIAASIALDATEAAALGDLWRPGRQVELPLASFDPDAFWRTHPTSPAEALTLALRHAALASGTIDEHARAVSEPAARIGLLAAARKALDLGDALMLRLPDHAAPLFVQAHRWFEASDGGVGGLLAAIRWAIVATDKKEATDAAVAAYRPIANPIQGLVALPSPFYESISSWRENARLTLERTPREWRPQVWRLLACLNLHFQRSEALLQGPEPPLGPDTDVIVFSRTVQPQATAAALAPVPAAAEPRSALTSVRPALVWIGKAILFVFYFAIGLGIIGGALTFVYRGFDWVLTRLYSGPVPPVAKGGLFLAFLIGCGVGFPRITRAVRREWASRIRAAVTIDPAGSTEGYQSTMIDEAVRLTVTALVPRLSAWPPFIREQSIAPVSGEATSGGLAPYSDLAQTMPDAIVNTLRSLPGSFPGRPTRVDITLPTRLQGPCWEAMLQLPAGSDASHMAFTCLRLEPSSPLADPTARIRGRFKVMTLGGDGITESMARTGWSPLRGLPGRLRWEFVPQWPTMRAGTVRLVHLVGRIEDDAGGLAFVRGGREASRNQAQRVQAQAGLRATDLIERFPAVRLLVLQPDAAQTQSAGRLSSDREDAARARLFAAELCSVGVPLVLVLPRLDAPSGATALQTLARALAWRGMPNEDTLLSCAARIQRAVAQQPGDSVVALEPALDVTVCATQHGIGQ